MLKKLLATAAALGFAGNAMAADLSEMTWDEIMVQAKEEGEVNWYVWYFEDRFRVFVEQFTEETGIKVTIPEGDHVPNIDKTIADGSRETGDVDVLAIGYDRLPDVPQDLFTPLTMLPPDDGRITTVAGIDPGDIAVAYWGNQTGIAYDPEQIADADLPQTPEDLAAYWKANPGKFAFNYENGGSGPSFYMNVLRVLSGMDFTDGADSPERLAALDDGIAFFNDQAENYEITASNADSLTRISDGEFALVAAWEDHLAGLQNTGEVRKDIKFYIPEMGMFGGGNAVVIPKNAPHPAAAAVLINWLASPEVQTQFNVEFGTAPMHAEADDSAALVSSAMRERQTIWTAPPFRDALEQRFIEDVIQER